MNLILIGNLPMTLSISSLFLPKSGLLLILPPSSINILYTIYIYVYVSIIMIIPLFIVHIISLLFLNRKSFNLVYLFLSFFSESNTFYCNNLIISIPLLCNSTTFSYSSLNLLYFCFKS